MCDVFWLQIEAYVLWTLRDAPGQATLKAFQPQPRSVLPFASVKDGSQKAPAAAAKSKQAAASEPSSPVQQLDFSQVSLQGEVESQQDAISDSQSSHRGQSQQQQPFCGQAVHGHVHAPERAQIRNNSPPHGGHQQSKPCRHLDGQAVTEQISQRNPIASDGPVQPPAKRQRLDTSADPVHDMTRRPAELHPDWTDPAVNADTDNALHVYHALGNSAQQQQQHPAARADHASAEEATEPTSNAVAADQRQGMLIHDPFDDQQLQCLEEEASEEACHKAPAADMGRDGSATAAADHEMHELPQVAARASAPGQQPGSNSADDAGMARARRLAAAARASCDVLRGPVR